MDSLTIRGWMTERERMALRRWAFDLDVLELGCYEGLSTAQLLATAKSVYAIDTFDGRGTPEPKDTRDIFHRNMRETGHYDKLAVWPGTFADVLPKLYDRACSFDLVFIDGSHDYQSVVEDFTNSRQLVRTPGAVVFHDYDSDHPGVVSAVHRIRDHPGWYFADKDGSLVMLRRTPAPPDKKIKVAVLMPHRDGWGNIGAAWSVDNWLSKRLNRQVYNHGTSVLTRTFNELLCYALNDREEAGFTHLAMLHNDIIPDHYWLDMAMDELDNEDLDCLGVVVAIKNKCGLTSTGLDVGNPWGVRRLTLKEIFDLPATFTAKDVPYRVGDNPIVLNSGCFLMRFDQPWFNGLCFRQQDGIMFHEPTGKYVAQSISEDWDFSRQLVSRGCRIAATRKISTIHDNEMYHTRSVWGEWKTDHDFLTDTRANEEYLASIQPPVAEAAGDTEEPVPAQPTTQPPVMKADMVTPTGIPVTVFGQFGIMPREVASNGASQ
jgi:hypothetical protein